MGANPYYDPDADRDVLDDEKIKSGNSNRIYEVRGPRGEELPADLKKQLQDYLESTGSFGEGHIHAPSSQPPEFRALTSMFGFLAGFRTFKSEGPLLYAMADILNDLSGGRLYTLWQLREVERRILYLSSQVRFLNSVHEYVTDSDMNFINELTLYFKCTADITEFLKAEAEQQYLSLCATLDLVPDEGFASSGIYSDSNDFLRILLGNPYTLVDENEMYTRTEQNIEETTEDGSITDENPEPT